MFWREQYIEYQTVRFQYVLPLSTLMSDMDVAWKYGQDHRGKKIRKRDLIKKDQSRKKEKVEIHENHAG